MPAPSLATYIAICIAMVLGYEQLYRQWVKPGAGVGVGAYWVKPGDWELGDHVNEVCCFDSK